MESPRVRYSRPSQVYTTRTNTDSDRRRYGWVCVCVAFCLGVVFTLLLTVFNYDRNDFYKVDFDLLEEYLDRDAIENWDDGGHRIVHSYTSIFPFCDHTQADGRIGFEAYVTRIYNKRNRILMVPCDYTVPSLYRNASSKQYAHYNHDLRAPSLHFMICNDVNTFVLDTHDPRTGLQYMAMSKRKGDACMNMIEESLQHKTFNRRKLGFLDSIKRDVSKGISSLKGDVDRAKANVENIANNKLQSLLQSKALQKAASDSVTTLATKLGVSEQTLLVDTCQSMSENLKSKGEASKSTAMKVSGDVTNAACKHMAKMDPTKLTNLASKYIHEGINIYAGDLTSSCR